MIRYPIYVPSKGRAEDGRRLTIQALRNDGVPFRVVVEPQEADAYREIAGEENVLVLPFSDLGQGSIPARNWIRDHAEAEGHAKHHQLDDNISGFYRLWKGRRILCHAGLALSVLEDFADRFENVAVAGLNYDMFVTATTPTPYRANVHAYSSVLFDHRAPFRHRGRFNEDTDWCLQALTDGWCTILVNAFCAKKTTTMTLSGGNTDTLYETGAAGASKSDTLGRFEMARALERAWPGTVRTVRKYERYQHAVDWKKFQTPLRLRNGLDLSTLPEVDERGAELREVGEVRSGRVRAFGEEYAREVDHVTSPDPLWRGMPAFLPVGDPPRLEITFPDETARDAFVERLGIRVDKKFRAKAWSASWPPRDRDDFWSLRFEPPSGGQHISSTHELRVAGGPRE